ncbi:Disease resistance protein [Melia azedarach]|uniref:Disease resistance protein n=1 Tax=Melia azedarach TaxID=155640 RepID=A0ACC1XNM0_MELAZ|nr:Disease resistance protein [Melia azedarach]
MECLSSITGSFADKVVDKLFNAAGRQFGYLYNYNDNIENLRKQAKKLADARDKVQRKIDAAQREGKAVEAEVRSWIEEVDNIAAEADKFLQEVVPANKKCLGGWCINLRSRYRFGKEAEKKAMEISDLQAEGKFENVSSPTPPPAIIISSSPGISRNFESRKSVMKQTLGALNDENVSIIGICGMGGVGKTTIAKEIGKKAKEDKLVDEVVMAVVSRNPSIETIQKEIADILGLPLSGSSLPARARSLWARIKTEKRILIILDDVWEPIELDTIGIPCGENHRGCKIVLTSRSQKVCNQMDAKLVEISTLSKQESWKLFREVAGQVVDDSDINPVARKIADKCGGLPIAILTVGRALKNKNKYVWKDAAQQLKKSSTTYIEGMQRNVISSLELSYNCLESQQEESLFLFCCLFPEDFKIPVEVLARYGIGLNWFENVDTVEEARNRAHAVVSSLTSSFLLMGTDEQGFVKMHDVVRDFAIAVASKLNNTFMVNAGIRLLDFPSRNTYADLTGISLMCNDIHEVPDHGLECPKLQALLLQQNSALVIPSNFFQGMKDLKVLDLSDTKLLSLPQSLSFLANLRTLCLSRCKLGDDLSVIGELTRLEILNLSRSDIKEIPASFSQLSQLRLLEMNLCNNLKLIPRGVISSLSKLEELFMFECFIVWDFRNNSRLAELQDLSRITKLMINIPRYSYYPEFISFQNLTTFIVSVGITYKEYYEITVNIEANRRLVILSHDLRNSPLPDWVKDLLKRSEHVILHNIRGTENVVGDLVSERFTDLRNLTVRCCFGVKYVIDASKPAFPNLEKLVIYYSPHFVEICRGLLPAEAFGELKEIDVNMCDSALHVVSSHLLQRLISIKEIFIRNCQSLLNVFELEGLEIVDEESQFLTSLERITLANLPKMTHVWKGNIRFLYFHSLKILGLWNCNEIRNIFPQAMLPSLISLERIEVSGCHNLEEIFGKKEEGQEDEIVSWKKCHTEALGNLTYINVESCSKVVNLFTTSIAKSLVQLKKMDVSWCSAMQEIVSIEEGESAERIVFLSLYSMELKGLDSLTCFLPGLCPIEFPALERVKIVGCPKMKTFGFGDQVTPKLKKVNLEGKNRWMGNLNDTLQKFFHEQESIRKEATRAERLTENIGSNCCILWGRFTATDWLECQNT